MDIVVQVILEDLLVATRAVPFRFPGDGCRNSWKFGEIPNSRIIPIEFMYGILYLPFTIQIIETYLANG